MTNPSIRPCHKKRAVVIPNRPEQLHEPLKLTTTKSHRKGPLTCHIDNIPPRNVAYFEFLPENTLGLSVEYTSAASKLMMPLSYLCAKGVRVDDWLSSLSRLALRTKDSRELDVFQPLMLTQQPLLPFVEP